MAIVDDKSTTGRGAGRAATWAATIALGLVVVALAAWVVVRHLTPRGTRLPVLGVVSDFVLTGSDGAPVSAAALRGHIWVADFIYTQCPSFCPMLSAQMAKLQQALAAEPTDTVRLVSFTVDPANDTPAVLRAYGERLHADPRRWLFLTGTRDALYTLIGTDFHLAVAARPADEAGDGQGLITHSDRFVLVDRELRIRGYYHGTEGDMVPQLLRDITALHATP